MSITYPLSLPSSPPGIEAIELSSNDVVGIGASPFTGQQQILEWPGNWWTARISLPPMYRVDAERWIAFLVSLKGMSGTFLLGDPNGKTPLGIATGTPLVNGSNQTGKVLATKGWTPSIAGILKAGDYLQIGSGATTRLYKAMKDANSDASGNCVVDVWPSIRDLPADGAAIVTSSAKGTFRRNSNQQAWTINKDKTYSIAFDAIEAI